MVEDQSKEQQRLQYNIKGGYRKRHPPLLILCVVAPSFYSTISNDESP